MIGFRTDFLSILAINGVRFLDRIIVKFWLSSKAQLTSVLRGTKYGKGREPVWNAEQPLLSKSFRKHRI